MPPASPNATAPPNPSIPPQSIPLRDLSRPPDSADSGDEFRRHSRGRSLLSGGPRPLSGHDPGPRYERLGDSSPTSLERRRNPHIRTPRLQVQHQQPSLEEDVASPSSPVGNPAEFQAAMGFAGLLVPDISVSHAPRTRSISYGSEDFTSVIPYNDGGDEGNYFASESDQIPLTDSTHQQPISGARTSSGQDVRQHNRAFRSVSFGSQEPSYGNSRLGDDLENAEAGLGPGEGHSRRPSYGKSLTPESRPRSRSPSTVTAFSKAGSIVRAMSQRVVNLSGEAALMEDASRPETVRNTRAARQASQRSQTSHPPAVSSDISDISSLSGDGVPVTRRKADALAIGQKPGPPLPTAPIEKALKFFGRHPAQSAFEEEYQRPQNPLKGKSLGIFSPESKIRNYLCDVLVYPLTEPAILLLIVLQTVLLAVDSSRSVYTAGRRPLNWGHSPIDWALLGLFMIFTIEVAARIIVSGFIYNAPEYDALSGKRSMKSRVLEQYRAVFKPQRQSSLRVPRDNTFTTPDVLRSFTAKQGEAIRTVEQAQRLQLARRAFLRHSFNRLDFIAVVSFWIAFILGITSIESSYHLYVFRMMSCLRILRLLFLTHGTAVSILLCTTKRKRLT